MIIGGFQPAVVETERLARAILKVKLAIVTCSEMACRKPFCLVGVERPVAVESGAGRGSRQIRRAALEHEAAVAITALDEAGVGLDPQEDPRMAERRRDLARAVAGDLDRFDANGFGGRDLHGPHVATAPCRFNERRRLEGNWTSTSNVPRYRPSAWLALTWSVPPILNEKGSLTTTLRLTLPLIVQASTVIVSVPPTRVIVIAFFGSRMWTTFFTGDTASNIAE